jgi:hypothetical protein
VRVALLANVAARPGGNVHFAVRPEGDATGGVVAAGRQVRHNRLAFFGLSLPIFIGEAAHPVILGYIEVHLALVFVESQVVRAV